MAKKLPIKNLDDVTRESSQRILLEEYRLLENRFDQNRNQGITRMNFFITSTSVLLGSVLVFGSRDTVSLQYLRLILLVALIVLSAIGLDVYIWLIQRDISADRYERGLARIRYYFLRLDPGIEDYFINNTFDIPTRNLVRKSSGVRGAAQIVESFLLGLVAMLLSTFLSVTIEVSISIGASSAVLIFSLLEASARIRLNKALKIAEDNIKFKSNEKRDT
ncbi:MAG TPA: hypothetical protein VN843_34245 [Anaerolineales bacterium]|nr:hypothetical protein [Anaerolineales bacterium]